MAAVSIKAKISIPLKEMIKEAKEKSYSFI